MSAGTQMLAVVLRWSIAVVLKCSMPTEALEESVVRPENSETDVQFLRVVMGVHAGWQAEACMQVGMRSACMRVGMQVGVQKRACGSACMRVGMHAGWHAGRQAEACMGVHAGRQAEACMQVGVHAGRQAEACMRVCMHAGPHAEACMRV